MHAPPLPSTIVLLCAMSSFGLTSALPTEPVKTEQTVEFYKLPAYDDFEGFTAPAERKDCGWLDMDYDADDWTGSRSGENEIYSRRWDEDEDNIHHGQALSRNETVAEAGTSWKQGDLKRAVMSITSCTFTTEPKADCNFGVSTWDGRREETFRPTWLKKQGVTLEKVTITYNE